MRHFIHIETSQTKSFKSTFNFTAQTLDKEKSILQVKHSAMSLKDGFQKLRDMIYDADALVFSTPVYFGDISESAKNFLDRWRRCERSNPDSLLIGKPAIGIAAAGGSGGGAINALHNLETYLRRLQFTVLDLVPVTQKSKKHKLDMLKVVGSRLASQE